MMTIAREEIAKAAIDGAETAVRRYMKMSGGCTVHDDGIESYISSKIAEFIYDKFSERGATITLEARFSDVHTSSKARRGNLRAEIASKNAKFDVCYSENELPIAAMEVKKRFAFHKGHKDIARLVEAVRRFGPAFDGSLRFGVWLAVQRIAINSRTTAESQIKKFKESFASGKFAVKPHLYFKKIEGEFGIFKRSGREVVELRIYAVSFEVTQ